MISAIGALPAALPAVTSPALGGLSAARTPLAAEVVEAWQQAMAAHREVRSHVVERLQRGVGRSLSAVELTALQYDVTALSLQQEVLSQVARKATDAVSTLIKNG